ncbi:MAG: hypothetical protein ACC644_03620 [Candidatus Hydrothermarchaeales archaeon]
MKNYMGHWTWFNVSLSLKPIPSLLVKVNGKYIIAGVKSDEELQLILTRCCRKPGRG